MSTQNSTTSTANATANASTSKPPVTLSQKPTTNANSSNITAKQLPAAGSASNLPSHKVPTLPKASPSVKVEPCSNSASFYSGVCPTTIDNSSSITNQPGCSNIIKREVTGTQIPQTSQTSQTLTNQQLSQSQSMLKSHSMRNSSTLNLDQNTHFGQQTSPSGGSQQMNRTRSVPVYNKSQPHPIAIKPRPIAIAPSPLPHKHGHHTSNQSHSNQLKSVGLIRNLSTMSNQGSEEITLTTSKNWVLPPRPKVKKSSSSRKNTISNNLGHTTSTIVNSNQANISSASSPIKVNSMSESSPSSGAPGRIKINSQIHSNINLHTNNQLDLKIQLQNVSKENDNLKKILTKLRKEIGNLSLLKTENDKKLNIQSKTTKPYKTTKKSSTSTRSSTATLSTTNSPLNASSISSISISPTDTTLLSETNTIDPINLSYHLDSKRPKTNKSSTSHHKSSVQSQRKISTSSAIGISAIGGGSKDYYLSPKDIMIHPVPVALKKQEQGLNHNNNNNIKSISPKATTKSRKKIALSSKQDCGQCKKGHCQCMDTPSPTLLPPLAPKLLKKTSSKDSTISKPRSKSKSASSSKLQQKQLQKNPITTPVKLSVPEALLQEQQQNEQKPVIAPKIPSSSNLNLASDWFAKNPLLDFDMYNEDMSDIISDFTINSEMQNLDQTKSSLILDPKSNGTPTSSLAGNNGGSASGVINIGHLNNGNKITKTNDTPTPVTTSHPVPDVLFNSNGSAPSPKFDFRFDENDDFMMY